jgi:hypothetical protein
MWLPAVPTKILEIKIFIQSIVLKTLIKKSLLKAVLRHRIELSNAVPDRAI